MTFVQKAASPGGIGAPLIDARAVASPIGNGTTLAQVAAPPAGKYCIRLYFCFSGSTNADVGIVAFKIGATVVLPVVPNNGTTSTPYELFETLDGASALQLLTTGAGSGAAATAAAIVAQRIG